MNKAMITVQPANEIGAEGLAWDDPIAHHQLKYALGFAEGRYVAAYYNGVLVPKNDDTEFAFWVSANVETLVRLDCGLHSINWDGDTR